MNALKNITKLLGKESFHYIHPVPPDAFGRAVHALCVRNPYIPYSSGMEGKEYGKAFEISSIYGRVREGLESRPSATLDGYYVETNADQTDVYFTVSPHPFLFFLAVFFLGIGCLLLFIGGILLLLFHFDGLISGGAACFLAILPILLNCWAKYSLKKQFVNHFQLKPARDSKA